MTILDLSHSDIDLEQVRAAVNDAMLAAGTAGAERPTALHVSTATLRRLEAEHSGALLWHSLKTREPRTIFGLPVSAPD